MPKRVYLTRVEAARFLRCHPGTLDRWAKAGHLNVYRTPGGHKRYRLEELERMLRGGAARGSSIMDWAPV